MSKHIKRISKEKLMELLGVNEDVYEELVDEIIEFRANAHSDRFRPKMIDGPGEFSQNPQFYRLTDTEDFPAGSYIYRKTGNLISQHFRLGDGLVMKQTAIQEWLSKSRFTKIHTKDYVSKGEYYSSVMYELETEVGVLLMLVQDYLIDFPKNKAKIGKMEVS